MADSNESDVLYQITGPIEDFESCKDKFVPKTIKLNYDDYRTENSDEEILTIFWEQIFYNALCVKERDRMIIVKNGKELDISNELAAIADKFLKFWN